MIRTDSQLEIKNQLGDLASQLLAKQDAILARWRAATESSPELSIASSLTRVQFNDHIPNVLQAFATQLRVWPDASTADAQADAREQVSEHGLQRWQQGYQLPEMTREWGLLQTVLMEELEEYAAGHSQLNSETMPTARRALSQLCWDGITESTTKYWHLHQAEAAGHVQDLEQALADLSELERARAEAWREAAHDLRGSVSVVKLAASIVHAEDVPASDRVRSSEILQKGVSSLHQMLTDLMSLARLEAGQEHRSVEEFDAAVMLQDICATSQAMAQERGLVLKTEGPDSLRVQGDRAKIQRILQNLLLNALKYTSEGEVKVIWGNHEIQGSQNWMFCVQDTGPGLTRGMGAPVAQQIHTATQNAPEAQGPSHHAPIPTAPTQSQSVPKQQRPGEGVGLSIVKRLCELLDASLELETSPGAGTTFRVVLPSRY